MFGRILQFLILSTRVDGDLLHSSFQITLRIQICPKKGIIPIHSYSFRMGLEPSILFDREGSGFLGLVEAKAKSFSASWDGRTRGSASGYWVYPLQIFNTHPATKSAEPRMVI